MKNKYTTEREREKKKLKIIHMHIRVEENKLLCKKSSIKRKMQVCSMMKIKQNQRKKDEFSRASCVKD